MQTKPKNINNMASEAILKRVESLGVYYRQFTDELKSGKKLKVTISEGNRKLGDVPSVSLMPVLDCCNCSMCARLCYDIRNDCRYASVRKSRAKNSAILHNSIADYFAQIQEYILKNKPTAFRYHIGGDITSYNYLMYVVTFAKVYFETEFLLFTKMDSIVNEYISDHGELPKNLHIIFSNWPGKILDNQHNLPTSSPVFSEKSASKLGYNSTTGTEEGRQYYFCTGNCSECSRGTDTYDGTGKWRGCWGLQKGEGVLFNAH